MNTRFLLILLFYTAIFEARAQTAKMRSLPELVNKEDPGWALISKWIAEAKNHIQVLPKTASRADSALLAAQVTTGSPLGAIIYETGGILVDSGWLRILGSGSPSLNRDIMSWNTSKNDGFLLVADDLIGGFFAINAGAFGSESLGKVFYLSLDNLEWEPTDRSYSDFLIFCFSGDLEKFYLDARWRDWARDVRQLSGMQGITCYPYLFTKEAGDINKVTRKTVPIVELWTFQNQMRQQLNIH